MNILVKTSLVFIVKLNLGGGWRNIQPIILEGRRVGLHDLGRGLKIVGANEWSGGGKFPSCYQNENAVDCPEIKGD